jgi:xylulose-5-phosphate/fructose-6-phosphate phosphoketolase
MIFLKDNAFMERDLTFDDIKPRLLGQFSYHGNLKKYS